MKFKTSILIEKPRDQVANFFQNDDYRKDWQEGFISCELLSGNPKEKDAKSRIIFTAQNQEQELIETVIHNDFPNEFKAFYEHKHMDNFMTSRFIKVGENQTQFEAEVEYTKFKGFLIKVMVFFMAGMFKKQMEKHNMQFKKFVENQA